MTAPSNTVNVFGWEAPEFVMPLYRDSDYTFALEADPAWPNDVTLQFRFSSTYPNEDDDPIIWTATIQDNQAVWDITESGVNEVLDSSKPYIRLAYVSSGNRRRLYMKGTVRAN